MIRTIAIAAVLCAAASPAFSKEPPALSFRIAGYSIPACDGDPIQGKEFTAQAVGKHAVAQSVSAAMRYRRERAWEYSADLDRSLGRYSEPHRGAYYFRSEKLPAGRDSWRSDFGHIQRSAAAGRTDWQNIRHSGR